MALDISVSVHNKTHLLSNLPASCCALGYSRKGKYHLGEYCKEAIRELIRYLRRDDADHTARRYLGKSKILISDLLPIVKHYHEDEELFDLILRLLVNLTNPVLLLYNEELPSDASARRCYLQIISQLQAYKEAFADESLWAVLANKLTSILKIDSSERTEEVGMIAERILVLNRNILQVPADPAEERPDSDASIHDRVVWALGQSGLTDLILYISSVDSEQAYCMHVLEIICLMLREQSGTELAESQAERSLAERTKDVEELMTSLENEKVSKYNKMKSSFNTRHPRFGGSFVVRNTKGIGENDIIVHKPYEDTEKVPHDIKKEKSKVRKNEMALKDDEGHRRSPFGIRLFLQKFCNEFLSASYNNLMRYVKGCLMRRIAQPNDESFYLWAMKFFMEFNRAAKNEIKLVSETMNVSCFYWVITQLEHCHGMLKSDKMKVLFWSRRTHHALRAYLELMRTLTSMEMSNDKAVRESARVIQGNLFYVVEHRESLLWLLNSFDESKMSRGYLQDLIETLHVFTKLLERFCKSQRGIVVQTRRVKRKKKKSKKSAPAASKPAQERTISNEELWNDVVPEVSVVLSSGVIPDDIVPFDAASDRDIEDQKVDAMRRIHTLLKHRQYEEAVGLLRTSREVWQENDIFGRANSNPEDELSTLREVFFAEIAQDPEVVANVQNAEEENRGDEDEEEEEDTDEGEEGVPNYSEKQYDFNDFLKRLVCSQAIQPACLLLKTFETNPKFINHCVAKLLHRIAWEAKSYAVLFQASLFIQFRKVMASPRPEHQELAKLAKFVFGKFVEVAQKNKLAFVELLPWKSAKQAFAVEGGYDDMNKESSAAKKAWKEEEEDELRRLHAEYMRDEPGEDMVEWILERLINRDRTKLGVRKKLRELFLIQPSGKSKLPTDWSEAEICELTQLWGRYKDSNDPLDSILMGLTVKRGKSKVIDKLLELGLVSDRKKLYKKSRSKANVRRGGNNSSSDDSDSGTNRQKKNKKKKAEQKDRAALKKAQRKGPASRGQVVSTLFQVLEADMRGGLQWLLESLNEAADDLEVEEGADSAEGIPLLPVEEDAVAAMDDPLFHRLLQNLGIAPPFDEQEVYWRIPEDLSAAVIREKTSLLESALDGTLSKEDVEDEVLSEGNSSGQDSGASRSSQKQKEKKPQSSGRRLHMSASSSEEDLVLPSERTRAVNETNKPESEHVGTSQSHQKMKRRPRLSDSSSDDELILTSERRLKSKSDDEPSSQRSASTSQSQKKKSKDRRPHLSDSSSDEVSLSELRATQEEGGGERSQQSESQQKKSKNTRTHLSDTGSDEDLSFTAERRPTQENSAVQRRPKTAKKSKDRRPRLSDSSSDDEYVRSSARKSTLVDSDEPVTPLKKSTQISRVDTDSNLRTGSQSVKKKKTMKNIINKSLLESDLENEPVPSPVRSVEVDENDFNSGNVLASRRSAVLGSDSDSEQRTQIQKKKKKVVLSDSEDEVVQDRIIVVSLDKDINPSENINEKSNGKRVLSSSDEETSIPKKRAVEVDSL